MRRVYTDERFPDCEIVNDGSLIFEVYTQGQLLHTFETWEKGTQGQISEAFAAQRAQDYFDRSAKIPVQESVEEAELDADAPVADQPTVTASIDDLMAREKLEMDPARKKTLRGQIMQLMRQEGSVAVAVVNDLIAG